MPSTSEIVRQIRALLDQIEPEGRPAPTLERRPATAAAMAGGTREVVGVLKFVDDVPTKSGKPMVKVKVTARENGRDIEERLVAFGDVCVELLKLRGQPVRVFLKPWKDTEQIVNVVPSRGGITDGNIPF
jgi:hypothetical protein